MQARVMVCVGRRVLDLSSIIDSVAGTHAVRALLHPPARTAVRRTPLSWAV